MDALIIKTMLGSSANLYFRERPIAQDDAVAVSRANAQDQAWTNRLGTLDAERIAFQAQEVAEERIVAQNDAWAEAEPSLIAELEFLQNNSVETARVNYQNEKWSEVASNLTAARNAIIAEAVAKAKADTTDPVVYLEGLPETIGAANGEPGHSFIMSVMVSGIDASLTNAASSIDILLNLPVGVNIIGGGVKGNLLVIPQTSKLTQQLTVAQSAINKQEMQSLQQLVR